MDDLEDQEEEEPEGATLRPREVPELLVRETMVQTDFFHLVAILLEVPVVVLAEHQLGLL